MVITHGNILAVFFSANAAEVSEGAHWYRKAHVLAIDLSAKYGVPYFSAVGIIAALSPNNRWERNVADAERLIKVFVAGGNPHEVKVCTFGKNKQKAIDILEGAAPLDVLSGRKVRAFYDCICHADGGNSVCVDGHAYAIWLGQPVPTSQTPSISAKLYETISEDYRKATKQINEITGQNYLPSQVQAITWVAWRNHLKGGN
ncbi:MAG: DUF7178 family protein [Hylemonella sp.]